MPRHELVGRRPTAGLPVRRRSAARQMASGPSKPDGRIPRTMSQRSHGQGRHPPRRRPPGSLQAAPTGSEAPAGGVFGALIHPAESAAPRSRGPLRVEDEVLAQRPERELVNDTIGRPAATGCVRPSLALARTAAWPAHAPTTWPRTTAPTWIVHRSRSPATRPAAPRRRSRTGPSPAAADRREPRRCAGPRRAGSPGSARPGNRSPPGPGRRPWPPCPRDPRRAGPARPAGPGSRPAGASPPAGRAAHQVGEGLRLRDAVPDDRARADGDDGQQRRGPGRVRQRAPEAPATQSAVRAGASRPKGASRPSRPNQTLKTSPWLRQWSRPNQAMPASVTTE